jgi:hypothetical protein
MTLDIALEKSEFTRPTGVFAQTVTSIEHSQTSCSNFGSPAPHRSVFGLANL